MGLIERIKGYIERKRRVEKRLDDMKRFEGKELELKMASFLFEISIEKATEFVREEFSRPESPFQGVEKPKLFHEITLLTFWAVKKVIGNRPVVIEEMHRNYSESFNLMTTFSEDRDSLFRRYEIYSNSWDDVWGHQDMLGLEVARYIFGNREEILRPDITFWLISYLDDAIKTFEKIKKRWIEKGIKF